MSFYANLMFMFSTNKKAQTFSSWLFQNDYMNKGLSKNIIWVTVYSHGDYTVVTFEALKRGAKILVNEVEDDY